MSRQLLEVPSTAAQVVVETGGELAVTGLPYVQVCDSGGTQGYRVVGYVTVVPSMSLEQLRKLTTENKPNWVVAMQADKEDDGDVTRGVRLIDNYGGLAEFKFSEDSITVRSHSTCLPTDRSLDDPGQFILPSVEEAFPGVCVTVSGNTDPSPHPLPTLALGAHATPQSGVQSDAQSGE